MDLGQFINLDMTGKVVLSVTIPFGTQTEHFSTYKIAIRHENSHALVNAALRAELDSNYVNTLL